MSGNYVFWTSGERLNYRFDSLIHLVKDSERIFMKKIGKISVKSSQIIFFEKTIWQLICYVKCIAFWENAVFQMCSDQRTKHEVY